MIAPHNYSKAERLTALKNMLTEAESRASHAEIPFQRHSLPGRKRDFYIVVWRCCPEMYGVSEGTIEGYMHTLGCKFPLLSQVKGHHDAFKKLFPECFTSLNGARGVPFYAVPGKSASV